jgi:TonB-dependent siderophore receptor
MTFRRKSNNSCTIALLLCASGLLRNELADAQQPSDTSGALQEVVVTAPYQFLSADTSGTTNLPLPVEKVPQSINLVSNDFINAADLKTLGEIAEYTPGATNNGSDLDLGSTINLRGYPAEKAVDGLNDNDTNFEPDFAIYDRLEIVQGPSSVVYGISSPGGRVNFVTKSATEDTPTYITVSGGSWDTYRVEAQGATALDASGAIRGIGIFVRDQGDSFMNYRNHQKTTFYGGLNFKPSDHISAYVHGGYERYVRNSIDGGLPSEPNGLPAPLPRWFFNGAPDMKLYSDLYHFEGDLTWTPIDTLEVGLKARFEHSETPGLTPYTFALQDNGDISQQVQKLYETLNQDVGLGFSTIYHLDDLGLSKSFVSLGLVRQVNQAVDNWLITAACNFNIYEGQQASIEGYNNCLAQGNENPSTFTPYDVYLHSAITTASLQAVINPIQPLSLLLGESYSKPTVLLSYDEVPTVFDFKGQFSARLAAIYEFVHGLNAYVSYSESFLPQENETYNNGVIGILPPLTGDQYEVGVKYLTNGGRLLLAAAAYQVHEKNIAAYQQSIDGVDYYQPIGEDSHKGVELSALGRVGDSWQINAAYSYLNPVISSATSSELATVGQTELFVPTQTASIYLSHDFMTGAVRGLSLGWGLRYVSAERTSYRSPLAREEYAGTPGVPVPGTLDIGGYVVADASASYTFGKWLVQLNGRNLFSKMYFINLYDTLFYGNEPGAPASVMLTIRRQF